MAGNNYFGLYCSYVCRRHRLLVPIFLERLSTKAVKTPNQEDCQPWWLKIPDQEDREICCVGMDDFGGWHPLHV